MRTLTSDLLKVKVYPNRAEMGVAAAKDAADYIQALLKDQDEVNIIFAAAPSQNDFLAELAKIDLPWNKVNAYHMDEYVGLSRKDSASFATYLYDHFFSLVPLKSVHYLCEAGKTAEEICENYTKALKENGPDIIFMGIGENGHIAFNDPHVAFFDDPLDVKVVDLDEMCRNQQVHDGCFPTLADVPEKAITLTVPCMLRAKKNIVVAPTQLKANAIKNTVYGKIETACPASILRHHKDTVLYTDEAGAMYLK